MTVNSSMEIFNDLYNFMCLLQQLIDRGETANINSIVDACLEGDIINFISQNYCIQDSVLFPFLKSELINKLYSQSYVFENDVSKRYGLNNNGLIYLVSIGFEEMYKEIKTLRKVL